MGLPATHLPHTLPISTPTPEKKNLLVCTKYLKKKQQHGKVPYFCQLQKEQQKWGKNVVFRLELFLGVRP